VLSARTRPNHTGYGEKTPFVMIGYRLFSMVLVSHP
jgi:hypothetical protein